MASASAQTSRGVRLLQVYPDSDEVETDIDIIAVHGLDTKSPDTWTWKSPRSTQTESSASDDHKSRDVNWLKYLHMLPSVVGRARIFTCDWPAELFQPGNLVQSTIDEIALGLLDGIHRRSPTKNKARDDRPIIFIASCLGGIILTKALVDADGQRSDYHHVRKATRGAIFLATPFEGTSFEKVALWAEPGLKSWALLRGQQLNPLLKMARSPDFDLNKLMRQFTQLDKDPDFHIFTFYETRTTSLPRKLFPQLPAAWSQEEVLVDFRSANPLIVGFPLPLDRPHVLTNKLENPGCPDYQKVAGKVQDFLQIIREGSPLQQAEKWIYENHYTEAKLQIERVSGELLSMEQCYINLAMIEQRNSQSNLAGSASTESAFSLSQRLKVETPDKAVQVELNEIFRPRGGSKNKLIPRRILIRGRAGVGKTTLCKKIVFECTRHAMWKALFDRVLWVRLRKLKILDGKVHNLESLFFYEYFSHDEDDGRLLARVLAKAIPNGRTLFILDGLDEVSGLLGQETLLSDFLARLLSQRNIIVTSRPHISLRSALVPDLELETIGFYPGQVDEYLKKTFPDKPETSNQIKSFLQDHTLVQDLVRIPVQLDALCYVWDEDRGLAANLTTMTGIYRAIEQRLWMKDVLRLSKAHDGASLTKSEIESCGRQGVEAFVAGEISVLERLAFAGLHNDSIEFAPATQQAAFRPFTPKLIPGKTLPCISFLRTSGLGSEPDRNYHFLHLTYQEYFAARYFVRQWLESPSSTLVLGFQDSNSPSIIAVQYLQEYKYMTRYNIFWRFVAGLLDAEGRAEEFFEAIEQEPRDMLGRMHQRLVIHLLSEVTEPPHQAIQTSRPASWQIKLENHFVDWLFWECRNYRFPHGVSMIRESELSSRVLLAVLQDTRLRDTDIMWTCMRGIQERERMPSQVINLLSSWLTLDSMAEYALNALESQSMLPKAIISQVVARMHAGESETRAAAMRVLYQQDVLSEEVLLRVVAQIEDEDWEVQEALANILDLQRNLPETLLGYIVTRLEDKSYVVRETVVGALKAQKLLSHDILEKIVARLEDESDLVRQEAVWTLDAQKPLSDTISRQIVARLGDENPYVRNTVESVLAARNALPEAFLLDMAAKLEDDDEIVRTAAMKKLRKQEVLPDKIVSQTTARLKNCRPEVQTCAIKVLAGQTALPEASLLQVATLLQHEAIIVRIEAIKMLSARTALPERISTHIVALLEDEHVLVRVQVLEALSKREQLSQATVSRILDRLQDREAVVRIAVMQTLRSTKALYSDYSRSQIAAQVERVKGSKSFVSDIVAQLRGTDPKNKLAALEALADESKLPEPILVHIAACLDEFKSEIQSAPGEALSRQAALSEVVLTEIAKHFDNSDDRVRQHALAAVEGRTYLPRAVVSQVAARLEDSDRVARWIAFNILIHQATLTGRDIMPHVKSLYREFVDNRLYNICWITTPSESYLQTGQKRIPIYDWESQMDIKVREIVAELEIPQLKSKQWRIVQEVEDESTVRRVTERTTESVSSDSELSNTIQQQMQQTKESISTRSKLSTFRALFRKARNQS